jgi:fido (protein-threonine AMPylation protein)
MPPSAEKLAQALELLHQLQAQGRVAIRSSEIPRTARERLAKNGFLHEVMKGWYLPTRPDEAEGESTAWFASFWAFCSSYLAERFDDEWCLSPEQSVNLLVGDKTVPRQLVVRSANGTNNIVSLPQGCTILSLRTTLPNGASSEQIDGLRVFSLASALVHCSPNYFRQNPTNARAALASFTSPSALLAELLEGGKSVVAGRLAGAFRNIGQSRIADEIVQTLRAADHDCREEDPFESPAPILFRRVEKSPYVARMQLMWQSMRIPILDRFPKSGALPTDIEAYLQQVQDVYVTDAYHSLSIEGYKVSTELIERVRTGTWNPDTKNADRHHRDALAAHGYWLAYQSVRTSLEKVLRGANAGQVADDDHGQWYRQLFTPGVTAGLLRPSDLAGYRNDQVYIRRSAHVPPSKEAVRDLMPAFFDLLQEESEAAVRVVLGHFFFVYIHPYMDGNGRTGRFLMNLMLGSGGYPWTIVPVTRRDHYVAALEKASTEQDVIPFTEFLSELVEKTIAGDPEAK